MTTAKVEAGGKRLLITLDKPNWFLIRCAIGAVFKPRRVAKVVVITTGTSVAFHFERRVTEPCVRRVTERLEDMKVKWKL